MKLGGRLFYVGAGTSGRIGILDASECPSTFGVTDSWIISIIAGCDTAIRKVVENAEDDIDQAWRDLSALRNCSFGKYTCNLGYREQAFGKILPKNCK